MNKSRMLPPLHGNKPMSVKSSIYAPASQGVMAVKTMGHSKSRGGARESAATISYGTSDPVSKRAFRFVRELSEITHLVHQT